MGLFILLLVLLSSLLGLLVLLANSLKVCFGSKFVFIATTGSFLVLLTYALSVCFSVSRLESHFITSR